MARLAALHTPLEVQPASTRVWRVAVVCALVIATAIGLVFR